MHCLDIFYLDYFLMFNEHDFFTVPGPCADPENFARGGPNLIRFFF